MSIRVHQRADGTWGKCVARDTDSCPLGGEHLDVKDSAELQALNEATLAKEYEETDTLSRDIEVDTPNDLTSALNQLEQAILSGDEQGIERIRDYIMNRDSNGSQDNSTELTEDAAYKELAAKNTPGPLTEVMDAVYLSDGKIFVTEEMPSYAPTPNQLLEGDIDYYVKREMLDNFDELDELRAELERHPDLYTLEPRDDIKGAFRVVRDRQNRGKPLSKEDAEVVLKALGEQRRKTEEELRSRWRFEKENYDDNRAEDVYDRLSTACADLDREFRDDNVIRYYRGLGDVKVFSNEDWDGNEYDTYMPTEKYLSQISHRATSIGNKSEFFSEDGVNKGKKFLNEFYHDRGVFKLKLKDKEFKEFTRSYLDTVAVFGQTANMNRSNRRQSPLTFIQDYRYDELVRGKEMDESEQAAFDAYLMSSSASLFRRSQGNHVNLDKVYDDFKGRNANDFYSKASTWLFKGSSFPRLDY